MNLADAPCLARPDQFERYRLLGALRPAELREWQLVRAAMLRDYLERCDGAAAHAGGDDTPRGMEVLDGERVLILGHDVAA